MDLSLKSLAPLATLLVTAVIVMSVGSQVVGDIKDQQVTDKSGESTVTNESVNFAANNTYYSLDNDDLTSLTAVYADAANSNAYDSSLYTYKADQGEVKIYTNGTGGYPNMTTGTGYVSYKYSKAADISESGQQGLEEMGDWMPTVGLVAAAAIVIVLLLSGFMQFV